MLTSACVFYYYDCRSDGKRGASPATLRGTKGADFENYGKIHRGVDGVTCGCFGGSSEKSTDRLILIKGPFCFIFENENSPSPKYAIGLQNMRDAVHGAGSSLRTSSAGFAVLLTTSLGDTEYEISFTLEAIAREFAATVQTQAAAAVTETVRKRLGHEHLLHKRSSVRYAEGVALKKIVDQPDAPVSTQEVLGNMPSPGAF
jgi:hypothetical protein